MGAPNIANYKGWTLLTASLQTIIQGTSLVQQNNIFKTPPSNFNGYPAVVVVPDSEKGMAIDTVHNKYIFHYKIMCFQTRLNLSSDQNTSYEMAEETMQALVDDLTVRLNTDITVGGIGSTWSRPVGNTWGYIKDQDVNTRTCVIDIEIEVGQ